MSFVFYDTETTGIDTWFDQILQFAAIKTDADFNEVDRLEIRCRLMPHMVPSPGAMRVTGVNAAQLTDPAYFSHYEMVRAIRKKLIEWSPALFMGYNSLEYDEDLIRQTLYKTLHNPYLTALHGNSRSDVLRMVHACHLFAPNSLAIPVNENGKSTFKLDRVGPANGFIEHNAHDAVGDVLATIHLCRLIAERAPDVWSAFMRFSKKASVVDFITSEPVFCFCDIYFQKGYSYLASLIGQNPVNKNEWYLFDLAVSPESLRGLSDDQMIARLARAPKPFRTIKANAVPIIFPADEAPATCASRDLGLAELERRAQVLADDPDFRQRLIAAHDAGKTEYPPSPHVEQQIYDGFFDANQHLMDAFHEVPWSQRPAIVEQFQDARLKTIGRRLLHTERPDLMDPLMRAQHDKEVAARLTVEGEDIPWLVLSKAIADLDVMLLEATDAEASFLGEHRDFLTSRLGEATAVLSASPG
jgi:exodeoxyribonuclease-1